MIIIPFFSFYQFNMSFDRFPFGCLKFSLARMISEWRVRCFTMIFCVCLIWCKTIRRNSFSSRDAIVIVR